MSEHHFNNPVQAVTRHWFSQKNKSQFSISERVLQIQQNQNRQTCFSLVAILNKETVKQMEKKLQSEPTKETYDTESKAKKGRKESKNPPTTTTTRTEECSKLDFFY